MDKFDLIVCGAGVAGFTAAIAAARRGLAAGELCRSNRGRAVPVYRFGEGATRIILSARHHASESTGSYVREGVLSELCRDPIPDTALCIIPFVDYDGVVDGDQGKSRSPHDHNRDYAPDQPSIIRRCISLSTA